MTSHDHGSIARVHASQAREGGWQQPMDEERLPGTSFISSEQRNALKDGLEVREAASNVSESSS